MNLKFHSIVYTTDRRWTRSPASILQNECRPEQARARKSDIIIHFKIILQHFLKLIFQCTNRRITIFSLILKSVEVYWNNIWSSHTADICVQIRIESNIIQLKFDQ